MLIGYATKCAFCGRIILDHVVGKISFAAGRAFHPVCLAKWRESGLPALPNWPSTRAGYFREFTKKPATPSLQESIRPSGSEIEAKVVDYLRAGIVLVRASRVVRDPLDQEQSVIGDNSIVTDLVWEWPEYYPRLIQRYHVSIPAEFYEHMLRVGWRVPSVEADE